MNSRRVLLLWIVVCLGSPPANSRAADEPGPPLPGTQPLTMTGDIASAMVAGIDRFLLKQIDESTANREAYWNRDFSSLAAYYASVEPNRKRLAHILGVRDQRISLAKMRRLTLKPDLDAFPVSGGGFRLLRRASDLAMLR